VVVWRDQAEHVAESLSKSSRLRRPSSAGSRGAEHDLLGLACLLRQGAVDPSQFIDRHHLDTAGSSIEQTCNMRPRSFGTELLP